MINRTEQPGFSLPDRIDIPSPSKYTTADGRQVLWLAIGTQDIVRVTLQFRAGTKYQTKSLQASSTLALMQEGTLSRTAQQIAEELDFYGSHVDYSIDRDHSTISLFCLSKYLKPTLAIVKDIIQNPKYSEAEFVTFRKKRESSLAIEKQKVMYVARENFISAIFGKGTSYGSYAEVEDYTKLTVDDFKAFHKSNYIDRGALLFVSGAVDEKLVSEVAAELNFVVGKDTASENVVDLSNMPSPEHIFIPKSDAVQSAIRIGRALFTRSHPDYSGMYVLTTILGGYFGSRLMANIREDKGYTYGIFAALVSQQESGYLTIGTEVGASVTDATLAEIYKEIERLRTEPVPYDELALVVNYLVGESLRMLDGPFGIVDAILELYQSRLPIEFLSEHLQKVTRITPPELMGLAQKYLDASALTEVIVGKKA